MCLNAGAMGRQDAESETLIPTIGGGFDDVAHTLRADGFDAIEGGTGRGTPLVPVHVDPVAPTLTSGPTSEASHGKKSGTDREALVALGVDVYNGALTGDVAATMGTRGSSENATGPQVLAFTTEQTPKFNDDCALTLTKQSPSGGGQVQCVAFSCKDHGADAGDIAPTLRSMGHDGSHANAGGQVAVAFGWQNSSQQGASASEHVSPTLDKSKVPAVGGGAMAVRRLTPAECETLQGALRGWTLVPSGPKRKPMADGPRYKMLGNSFAVTCVRWIGVQIQRAMRESSQQEAA
jgi:DNA (cytosine-5)-methyltransferase 1